MCRIEGEIASDTLVRIDHHSGGDSDSTGSSQEYSQDTLIIRSMEQVVCVCINPLAVVETYFIESFNVCCIRSDGRGWGLDDYFMKGSTVFVSWL